MTTLAMKKLEEASFTLPRKVAIVMITYNSASHIVPALDAIIVNTRYPFKLIVVVSESTDRTAKICDDYADFCPNMEVHHVKKEGALKAINYGLKVSAPYDVYLTHDDVIHPNLYRKDWLTEFVAFTRLKNCGVVTSLNGLGTSGPDYIDGFQWIGTWSMYIKRSTIERVGYFDENFGIGNGDDIDYSYRVQQAGLKCYVAQVYVEHHRITDQRELDKKNKEELEKLKQNNAAYFRKKHGIELK